MTRPHRLPLRSVAARLCCAATCLILLTGCSQEKAPVKTVTNESWGPKDPKSVPSFMRGTIWEKVEIGNIEPYQVSGFGLVVNLDNTGDSTAPIAVKEYMIKEMAKHGYGSKLTPGMEGQTPERVLSDKRVAIVQVLGMLPPGIRKGQQFDVVVQALTKNQTSSLAGGELYLTDLRINGADPTNPTGKVNDFAQAKGFVFVNPAYALNKDVKASPAIRASLRNGVIMNGGVARFDRPLLLRLRMPETRLSRYMEQRIIERFQDTTVAQAENEALIQFYVPFAYEGNWQHFSRLVTHLYLDSSPQALTSKIRTLLAEAEKPDAPLEDISFCWEGIGPAALPYLAPLMTDQRPDIAYAAARAAAFIGDPTGGAQVALMAMARNSSHPFQLNAVETLGALPPSAAVNDMLRELLESDKTLVRIEAYKVLAHNQDPIVATRVVTDKPNNQKFMLDVVPSHGTPIVYASRSGIPRIALIGQMPEISTPVMFAAMDDRLTISSQQVGPSITLFYRTPGVTDASGHVNELTMPDPVKMVSSPELWEVVQRLGGVTGADDEHPFNFTYSEVVAILARLHKEHRLTATMLGKPVPVAFVLQDPPAVQDAIYSAPSIDAGRPQADESQKVSRSSDPAAEAALIPRR